MLPQDSIDQHDVSIALANGSEHPLAVGGPRYAARDERALLSEVSKLRQFPVGSGGRPDVGAEAVIERKSETLPVFRDDRVKALPQWHAFPGDAGENLGWAILRLRNSEFVV